ncbi:hypothetical protein NR798_14065 [Archangium gephyra]|uniref:hypothetical protein n=1 Tax=Archangium gephyra TaxID=48 RepID=UPI0035D44FA8
MRRGKKAVSLMLQVLLPAALGACSSSEEPLKQETPRPTADQILPGVRTTIIEPCPIDQPCEPECPIYMAMVGMCEEPPPPVPDTPYNISYPSYSRSPSFTVSWSYASYGETYELEEQVNQGAWQPIYQGYGTSYTVSGRSPAAYNYRVRSCNVSGCGYYQTGIATVVNPAPVIDLYGQYPFLYSHDQQNAQYAAATQSFQTGFRQSVGIASEGSFHALDVVDGKFYLGQGYNLLKDELSQICLDTANPNFQVVSNPMYERSFSVERSTSVSHLAQLLDVELNGGLSLGLKNFTLDLSGSKKRLSEQVSDTYQEKLVVRWEYKLDHWTLNTVAEPLRQDFVTSMLIPNNSNARANFRERCGDKYIHAVTRGARLYMVFSFDTKKYTSTEREQKAATLKLKIQEVLNINGGGSVSSDTQQFLAQNNVVIKGYAVGGDKSTVEVSLSHADFGTKFQQFVNGVNSSNVAAIQPSMSHYPQPSQFLNYNYFQIFADYRTPAEQLRRWHAIDLEREQRCKLQESYGLNQANCRMAVAELVTAKLRCIETLSWSQCQHPLSYYTGVGTGGLPSTLLYNWMGQNISDLERKAVSQYFDHHVLRSSWGNKKCQSFTDDTCLPSSSCVVDTTQGENDGIGKGFSYITHEWDGPGSGSYNNHYISAGSTCIRTQSTLCTTQFGDSTADFKFTQGIFGQCPATRAFAIVN